MRQVVKGLVWTGVVASLVWQARQRDTPLIRWLAPLLQAQNVAVEKAGATVSQSELDLSLQQYLWRRGESLETLPVANLAGVRSSVVRDLLDQKLLRRARGASEDQNMMTATQREISHFSRMVSFDASRGQAALEAALHTERSFEQSVHEALLDERWLDERLSSKAKEDETTRWYEAHREQLRVPAACHAAHLFLSRHEPGKPDRFAEIQQLAAQLASGADWSALVSEHSEDERTRRRGGDLGWFTIRRMPSEFMAAVLRLRPGQVSAPVESSLGWHIIKLVEAKPERVPELDEVKAEIAAMLGNQAKEQAWPAVLAP